MEQKYFYVTRESGKPLQILYNGRDKIVLETYDPITELRQEMHLTINDANRLMSQLQKIIFDGIEL